MEDQIECAGFIFLTNFDSANLARVELVPKKNSNQDMPSTNSTKAKTNKNNNSNNNNNRANRRKSAIIELPDFEFNIWTNPDCAGTEFENTNRTWFYFGIKGGQPFSLVKLNIIDLNKQCKMYSQGMAPVYKMCPGKFQWERIRDKPLFTVDDNNIFTLSFKYRTLESIKTVTYFAFTYPFSYTELQTYLTGLDAKMSKTESRFPKPEIKSNKGLKITNDVNDAIYYHRECVCYSLEGRRVDLITISSHHNITAEREPRLFKLFPDESVLRPFKFQDKKVIFMSARVHPGETPSSFVLNGFINTLTMKDDPIALLLRKQYVFKLIPMLNPDGVVRGHYRTDTRGVNLNRYYLNPSFEYQPSIYAARQLIRYHHYGCELDDDLDSEITCDASSQIDQNDLSSLGSLTPEMDGPLLNSNDVNNVQNQISDLILSEKEICTMDIEIKDKESCQSCVQNTKTSSSHDLPKDSSCDNLTDKESFLSLNNNDEEDDDDDDDCDDIPISMYETKKLLKNTIEEINNKQDCDTRTSGRKCNNNVNHNKKENEEESGLFLYVDMHGHASKKGIFMYGNHFDKIEDSIECMLLPKIMSINSQNFQFTACNFTERNMYLRDKRDGTSREGSGRVSVFRITGLVRSYTLECNYNTGRMVNVLPQCIRDYPGKQVANHLSPPKFTPHVYEEIGRALAVSILDLTNSNPWTRIPNSEFHTLHGIRDWLRIQSMSQSYLYQRLSSKGRSRTNKSSQTQVLMRVMRPPKMTSRLLPSSRLSQVHSKPLHDIENSSEDSERKENITEFRDTSPPTLQRNVNGTFENKMCKEAGSSHQKRSVGRVNVGVVLQAHRAVSIRSKCTAVRTLINNPKKNIFRHAVSDNKFKKFTQSEIPVTEENSVDQEKRIALSTVSLGLGCVDNSRPRSKMTLPDQCVFKQGPKRLKITPAITKVEGQGDCKKLQDGTWGKKEKVSISRSEDFTSIPGPSSSDIFLYSRLPRPVQYSTSEQDTTLNKKRVFKMRPQLSPLKHKKSLEKRRGSDSSRKKAKIFFRKTGKLVLTGSEFSKGILEKKRRKT